MQHNLVTQAATEFAKGNYLIALDLYRKLSDQIGEINFRANIWLCQQRLRGNGRRDIANLDLCDIKMACVMDEFTFHSYQPECNLLELTPENAIVDLEEFVPDLLFIESAWRGKDELWNRKIGTLSGELKQILQWCRERQIPTVFWNKEDPVHFETFLTTAQQFDFVFTTDIDCIARYKAALGHDRVYILPFACQPKLHNPIELYDRKDAFCFAGAYYARYPERTKDLENYVVELPKFKPLEIFDRNYGKEEANYKFPEVYQRFIVGTLPFNEIDKAYKGYRFSINLNSIKQSQTMFARRVYELLGSNTITVSNFSRGLRLMFGDLVISSDSGKEIVERLNRLDDESRRKLQLAGLRKVMQEHTYAQRLNYVAHKALGRELPDEWPQVVVVSQASTKEAFENIIASFSAQRYQNKNLWLFRDGDWPADLLPNDQITLMNPQSDGQTLLWNLIPQGAWLATMVSTDYYGPNYLVDLASATRYSEAMVIGKDLRYEWEKDAIQLSTHGEEYRTVKSIPVRASLIHRESVPREQTIQDWLRRAPKQNWHHSCLAIDAFNYCKNGRESLDISLISNRVDDLSLDTGISIQDLLQSAEEIPAAETDDTSLPKWNSVKLKALFGKVDKQNIKFEYEDSRLVIKSILADGQHEYVYADDEISIRDLPVNDSLLTYLDITPGLNVQYVFIFLNKEKKRIGHTIHHANRNQIAPIPDEAAYLRIGLRIYANGESTIKGLQWGHRKQDRTVSITRSDTLLLTNHYPSYDDLYRNGFVHTRVKAYLARGVKVDVFRLRLDQTVTHHEFENIDVITGCQNWLRKLLESERYKRVLVHFLSDEMWDVLSTFKEMKVIVWVHGSEIQSWHRRDFNFTNQVELYAAKRESEKRLSFWRGLLRTLPKNLKLVFVSRYLAEVVMEDLGFRLPDDAYTIIHNPINTELFEYRLKSAQQRKKILSIRPYASRTYANDLSVAAILELSKKPFFKELEFRIIGDGRLFDDTLEPLRQFENVKIERRFLTQREIAQLHKEYGVFLCPTRMDTQGVSRDEAMASGLVPITNAVAAIPEFLDESCGLLAANDCHEDITRSIELLFNQPDKFLQLSMAAAMRVRSQSEMALIVKKELDELIGFPLKKKD